MSASEHTERGRQWLEEQLALLGNLRNANPRDPSFKLWRQNTLTVLQRIWPGEQARSERFRRITFSPASTRSDFNATREWYARGCAEATDLLRVMLAEVDTVGIPEPGGTHEGPPMLATAREDDFPVLELPSSDSAGEAEREDTDLVLLDQQGTADSLAPQEADPVVRKTAATGPSAPPRLHVPNRPPAAASGAPEPSPPALPARNEFSRPAPVASAESLPTMPAPPAFPDPPEEGEAFSPPASSAAASPHKSLPRGPDRRAGAADRRTAPRRAKTRRAEGKPRLKELLGLQDVGHAPPDDSATPAVRPGTASPDAVTPAPPPTATGEPPATPSRPRASAPAPRAATPPVPPAESDDVAQATANFLRDSPILGLQGKPVQRASDATQFLEPDAVALATLASDIGRYVSEESAREPLRVALLELAAQIEVKAPEWAALRDLVAAAMAFPELARRLMPIVLPWLGRAA